MTEFPQVQTSFLAALHFLLLIQRLLLLSFSMCRAEHAVPEKLVLLRELPPMWSPFLAALLTLLLNHQQLIAIVMLGDRAVRQKSWFSLQIFLAALLSAIA